MNHCWALVKTKDHIFGEDHGSPHCWRVWLWIIGHYKHCGTKWTVEEEKSILEAGTAFHEQGDVKFGQKLEDNIPDMQRAMFLDGLNEEKQTAVITMVDNCSFKKRKAGLNKEPLMLTAMIHLLCAADIAEAVGLGCLDRAFLYQKGRLAREPGAGSREPKDQEVWWHVYLFYTDKGDGYWPRMEAIRVPGIREALRLTEQDTKKKIDTLVARYGW